MKLTYAETAHICRGLWVLMRGGIGAAEGLYLLAEEEGSATGIMLTQMGTLLDRGAPLSAAMEQAGVFPHHAAAMVRIGEETGRLEQALESLANYYEQTQRTTRQMKHALAQPLMMCTLLVVVISVILMKVLPVFDGVYASLGSQLTGIAALFLHAGQWLEAALPFLLGAVALAALAGICIRRNARLRSRIAQWMRLRIGDWGVARKFNNARFARALAMGLSSGLPLEESLGLARRLLNDAPGAAQRCRQCEAGLAKGENLAAAMNSAGLLSPAQTRILAAGIQAGNADEVLEEIANRLQEDASDALERTISRVEPAIVAVSSLLVGVILLSVMLPLMGILSAIG